MPEDKSIEVKLESTLDCVDEAEKMVHRFAEENGFPEDDAHQIGMAVRESVVNAVIHGNCYNSRKKVSLIAEASHQRLTITVQDQGEGFDPDRIPDPLAEENLLRKTGRGLFLIRAFMDELHVNQLSPNGTEVVMIKNSPPTIKEEVEVSIRISTRQVNSVTIVDLSGRITLGEGSSTLRETVRDLVSKGQKHILLNLGDITYIDSSGIGELVSSYTTVSNQGGNLKLLNLQRKVHDLLQITKLYTVFDVHTDEAAAVKSYS